MFRARAYVEEPLLPDMELHEADGETEMRETNRDRILRLAKDKLPRARFQFLFDLLQTDGARPEILQLIKGIPRPELLQLADDISRTLEEELR